jgi:hypothetical protein
MRPLFILMKTADLSNVLISAVSPARSNRHQVVPSILTASPKWAAFVKSTIPPFSRWPHRWIYEDYCTSR